MQDTQQPAVTQTPAPVATDTQTVTPAPVADMTNVTTPAPVQQGTDITPGPAPVAVPEVNVELPVVPAQPVANEPVVTTPAETPVTPTV